MCSDVAVSMVLTCAGHVIGAFGVVAPSARPRVPAGPSAGVKSSEHRRIGVFLVSSATPRYADEQRHRALLSPPRPLRIRDLGGDIGKTAPGV